MMVRTVITQAVFEGQPSWVVSAAVCAGGRVLGFSCKAEHLTPKGKLNSWTAVDGIQFTAKHIGYCQFIDDWGASAIDRI